MTATARGSTDCSLCAADNPQLQPEGRLARSRHPVASQNSGPRAEYKRHLAHRR